jgi:sec1 family domain-containing protein 1
VKLGINSFSGSIERMLNLNHDSEEQSPEHHDHTSNGLAIPSAPILNSDGDPIWKVLVFDDLGRDVISSVLRVNDLRTWGVTMHMYVTEQTWNIANEG